MIRWLLTLYLLLQILFASSTLIAGTSANSSIETNAKSIATELGLLLISYGQFNQVVETMTESALRELRPEVEKRLGRELTRSEDEQFRVICNKVYSEVYPKEFWVEVIAKVYSDFFSKEEILSLIKFYNTQTGKKVLYLQPSLSKELDAVSLKLAEKKQSLLIERLGEELSKIPSFQSYFDQSFSNSDNNLTDLSIAIDKCKKIQESQELPIGCYASFTDEDEKPALIITLQNSEHIDLYWKKLSDNIGVPFCEATNISAFEGVVIIYIIEDKKARIFDCRTTNWTDWFEYELPKTI